MEHSTREQSPAAQPVLARPLDRLKHRIAGTALGKGLIRGRHLVSVLRTVRRPELGATLAQDACAEALLVRFTRPGRTFVDIGAHVGSVFGEVRRIDPSVKVVAVEALAGKVEAMRRRFPNVRLLCCALGERRGEVPFFVDTKLSGFSSMAQGSRGGKDKVEIRVPLRTLDDVAHDLTDIDLIKLDVEGAELGVLRGGERVLARSRPVVMFESGPDGGRGLGYSPEAVYAWFTARDFDVFVPNRVAHEGPALTREGFLDSHCFPRRTLNYFAVPREDRARVRARARTIVGA